MAASGDPAGILRLTIRQPAIMMSHRGRILSHLSPLAQQRSARGWSQAELARVSAVSRTEISAIETGRLVPSVAVALKLAAVLGESVETLFGNAGAHRRRLRGHGLHRIPRTSACGERRSTDDSCSTR